MLLSMKESLYLKSMSSNDAQGESSNDAYLGLVGVATGDEVGRRRPEDGGGN